MARIRGNNVFGTVTDNPLTNVATTLNAAGLANLPAVVAPDTAIITLDPNRINGAPEIVIVTAHTASATSATITRGAFGTAARQHALNTQWEHAPIANPTPPAGLVGDYLVMDPPRAAATRNSTQSIGTGAWTLVTFNVEDKDTDGMFTTGAGDRFTCVTPGRYLVIFTACVAANGTGVRAWAIAKGTTPAAGFEASDLRPNHGGVFTDNATISTEIVLAATETVSCQVFQNSGVSLNLGANAATTPLQASIRWVAPD